MKKLLLLAAAMMLGGFSCSQPAPIPTPTPLPTPQNVNLRNLNVASGQELSFPFIVTGEARGTWYFEASFPVRLEDNSGRVLQQTYAMAEGEWMTENFVPFKSQPLNPENLTVSEGVLVIEKDNPSGLPEHADELRIPVRFAQGAMTVKAYFINSALDPQRLDCSSVNAVDRTIPKTVGTARAALEQLLAGPTATEKQAGLITSINAGVTITSLAIANGTAQVTFSKKLQENMGGSCLVTSVRSQIEQTLKQFPTVQTVRISVEGLNDDEILQP